MRAALAAGGIGFEIDAFEGLRGARSWNDYRSRRFARALRLARIRHILTRPCTPGTNGRAERFHLRRRERLACPEGLTGSTGQDHTLRSPA